MPQVSARKTVEPLPAFVRPDVFVDALSGLVGQDDLQTKLASVFSQYTLYLNDESAGRPLVCVYGRSGCLAGETLIQTDCGELPIEQLAGRDARVKTPFGFADASVFRKGEASLYRVRHQRGEFLATADHRVLVASEGRWSWKAISEVRIGESLCASSATLRGSNWGDGLSVHGEDDLNSVQILGDWSDRCSADCRLCDERLLAKIASASALSPSPVDALEFGLRESRERHSPWSKTDLPSMRDFLVQDFLSPVSSGCRVRASNVELWSLQGRTLLRSRRPFDILPLVLECGLSVSEDALPDVETSSLQSIRYVRHDAYYDMSILSGWPIYETAGCWHHNSGKTYAIEKLVEAAGLPYSIASSASISPPSYRGKTMLDVFVQHWLDWHCDYGVIFLDEVDKWCRGAIGSDAESVSMGVRSQAEMLKYVEKDVVSFVDEAKDIEELEGVKFSTKRILFVLAGAFTGIENLIRKRLHNSYLPDDEIFEHAIPHDFKQYGMINELADRVETWAWTNPLKVMDIIEILRAQERPKWERRFESIGCRLDLQDGALGRCAQHAWEMKEAARVAKAMMRRAMDDLFVIAAQDGLSELSVDAGVIQSGRR